MQELNYKLVQGGYTPKGTEKIVIILSRFNSLITERLLNGAIDVLTRQGIPAENIIVLKTPGSFEIPQVLKQAINKYKEAAGFITLGAIIRGETPHFDYVASEVTRGIGEISISSPKPITFGILTTDTMEQAIDRAGGKQGNKGAEAALALLELINLYNNINKQDG